MVESATRFALLRTGETGLDANTAECLGYGDGGNGRQCQLQQREKLSKTEVGSPAGIRTTIHGSKGRCPTIRRPGIEAFHTVPRRNQLRVLVYLFQGVSRNAPARLPANMEAQKQRLSQAQLAY